MKHFQFKISALLPKRCVYCGDLISGDKRKCNNCKKHLPRITKEICYKCGREKKDCSCKGRQNYYSSLVSPFIYDGVVKRGIHLFKFKNNSRSAAEFGKEIAQTIKCRYSDTEFDYMVSVPMTEKQKKLRGFDQCALLCSEIEKITQIPYKTDIITKVYETDTQHSLNFIKRKGNMVGVFDCRFPDKVKDKKILLVDDISTSGETLNECAKMLWLYGADDIKCAVLALPIKKKVKKCPD